MRPVRSCVGCRTSAEKDELIRFVRSPSLHLQADLKGRLPGRGVYLCPRPTCFEQALKGQRLAKALRGPVQTPSFEELRGQVVQECRKKIRGLAGMASRAREVRTGRTALFEAFRRGELRWLLIAEDAAESSHSEYVHRCKKAGIPYRILFTREELGRIAGKDLRSALGFVGPKFVPSIERYTRITEDLETVPAHRAGQKGRR